MVLLQPGGIKYKMTKIDLLSQLENVLNSFLLGLGGYFIYDHYYHLVHLKDQKIIFRDGLSFDLDQICKFSKADMLIANNEFLKGLLRHFLIDLKQCIHEYAKSSNQETVIYENTDFRIARILRNAVAHDFIISLDKHDLPKLPIEFCGVTFEQSMHGKNLTFEIIDPSSALILLQRLKALVEDKMK